MPLYKTIMQSVLHSSQDARPEHVKTVDNSTQPLPTEPSETVLLLTANLYEASYKGTKRIRI